MTDSRDGFEWLREQNPVEESNVEGPDTPRAQELFSRIISTPPPDSEQRRGLTRRPVLLAVVLGVVALITVAAAWLLTRAIEQPQAILCYEAVDLNSNIAGAPPEGEATSGGCRRLWEEGRLQNSELVDPGQIPPLTACVTEAGALAVFPTGDPAVCQNLDLAHPDPAGQSEANALRDLEVQLIAYFQSNTCIPLDEATANVRAILDQAGFEDWSIVDQPPRPDRPCASHSFDPESRTIHLVRIPHP